MQNEIKKVLVLYATRDTANIEIANAILAADSELQAQFMAHVESEYGWCKEFMSDGSPQDNKALNTPCDWVFRRLLRIPYNGYAALKIGAYPPCVTSIHIFGGVTLDNGQLPELPSKLESLILSKSWGIIKLPKLPDTLVNLDVSYTRMRELPELPQNLQDLLMFESNIKILPILPPSLKRLGITDGHFDDVDYYLNPEQNRSLMFRVARHDEYIQKMIPCGCKVVSEEDITC